MADDFFAQIERFAALLPPATERIPTLIKMTTACYLAILSVNRAVPPVDLRPRFDGVRVITDDGIDGNWVAYDQHGEEMSRG